MFGLQRSCTNLVRRALCESYEVQSSEIGREWKHGPIAQSACDRLAIVCCVRDPYAWLWAMYRFSCNARDVDGCPNFQRDWSFADFLDKPHYSWRNPIERWNVMNTHYMDWVDEHPAQGIVVRSEGMMEIGSQYSAFAAIGKHFAWEGEPVVFERRVQHCTPRLGPVMDFEYYRKRQYLEAYSQEMLGKVTELLDVRLREQLGKVKVPSTEIDD
jgi:hypothetical protein